jgi:ABC-type antimicrobial peptide transport system permease subunit
MILRDSLRLVAIGAAVGLASAYGLTHLVESRLYGLSAADPATYAGVVVLLLAVATVASLIPARSAAKVDPMVALRAE